jgi:hypothetical protein
MLRRVRGRALLLLLSLSSCRSGCNDTPRAEPVENAPVATGPAVDAALPPAIPNAAEAVQRVRPALRACFAAQLGRTPTAKASVTFQLLVGADGGVIEATTKAQEDLEPATVACMMESVRGATFEKPLDGQTTTILAPFTFYSAAEGGVRDAASPTRDAARD